MIDYDKLRLAHELANKYYQQSNSGVVIESNFEFGCTLEYVYRLWIDQNISSFNEIDDLITKLKALTQPEPKYKVGDTVWMEINGEPVSRFIFKNAGPKYYLEGYVGLMYESELYPTKAELIEAQIKYWTSMREPEHEFEKGICVHCGDKYFDHGPFCMRLEYCNVSGAKLGKREECEHESDGSVPKLSHFTSEEGCVFVRKCIKCGEFYR